MPSPVSFAACEDYVFKRDFLAQKWIPVDTDNKPCRVQFMRRDSSYFMRLTNSKGERTDFPLSRESKLHFSPEGFLQIPLGDVKELYAIKFKDKVDGETFYAKVVNQMDLPWSAPKTTIGPDQFPNPAVNFGPSPLTLPAVPTQQKKVEQPQAPPHQSMAPQQSHYNDPGWSANPPGRSGSGDMGMRQNDQQYYGNQNQQDMHWNQPQQRPVGNQPQLDAYQPPKSQFENHHQQDRYPNQPPQDHYGNLPLNEPFGNQGDRYHTQQDRYQNQGGYGNQQNQYPERPLPNQYASHAGDNWGQPSQDPRFQDQNKGYPHQPGGGGGRRNFGPQSHQPQFRPQGNQFNAPDGGGYRHHQQQVPPARPPKPREPEPLEESQLETLAISLMKAINQGDDKHAGQLLQRALTAKTKLKIECEEILKPKPEPEFSLEVVIEFQQPQKRPLSIYLEKIRESFTIFDLQTMVEKNFHIPRSSQNWIIGSKLIKNDEKGPLKELGLKFVKGSDSQKVYLYVMHTKKANVAKEDLEGIQSRQRAQQKQQQSGPGPGVDAPQRQPPMAQQYQHGQRANYQGQQANYPLGGQGNFPQGGQDRMGPMQGQMADPNQSAFPQGRPGNQGNQGFHGGMGQQQGYLGGMSEQNVVNDPPYDRIGNRGYNPGFTSDGLPKFRVNQDPPLRNQYPPGPNEPLYESINNQGRPIEPDMRNPPPAGGRKLPPGGIQIQGGGRPPPGGVNVFPMVSRGQPAPASQAVLGFPNQLDPAPVPEPPKEKVGWKCAVCTFVNKPRRPGCEMCTNPRPEDYVVPDDTPLDTLQLDEKKNDELFEQYKTNEKQQQEEEALRNYQAYIKAEDAEMVTNKEEFDCLICYVPTEPGEGVILRECLHQFCKACLHDTITNAQTAVVHCPFDDGKYQCGVAISEREMKAVLSKEELEAVHKRGLREAESASANSFHCKTADCQGFCFYEDDVNEFHCPVCDKRNCLLCKAIHEGMDCKEYQDDLKRRAANDEAAKATQNMLEELVRSGDAMYCPNCKIIVQKKDGCDWIRCSMCRTEICWATKGPRWGPKGTGDTSGGCRCRVGGKKCTPLCRNCH